jgi:hypothetical protein
MAQRGTGTARNVAHFLRVRIHLQNAMQFAKNVAICNAKCKWVHVRVAAQDEKHQ